MKDNSNRLREGIDLNLPEFQDDGKGMRGSRASPLPYSSSSAAVRSTGIRNPKSSMKRPADDDDVVRPTMPTRPNSGSSISGVPPMPLSKKNLRQQQNIAVALPGLSEDGGAVSFVSSKPSTTSTVEQKMAAADLVLALDDEVIKAPEKSKLVATATTTNTEKSPSDPESISSFAPSANTEKRPSDPKSISSFAPPASRHPQQEPFQHSDGPLAMIEARERNAKPKSEMSKDSEKQKKKNIFRPSRNRRTRAQREKEKEQAAGREEQDTVKFAQAISLGSGPAYIPTAGNEGVDDHEFDILHSVSSTGHRNYDDMNDDDEEEEQEPVRPGAFAVKEGNARERTKVLMNNSSDFTLKEIGGSFLAGSSLTSASQEQHRTSLDVVSGQADINPIPLTPPRTMRSEQSITESPPGRAIAVSPGSQGRVRPRGTLTVLATHYHENDDQFPELDGHNGADSAATVYSSTEEVKWWMKKRTVIALLVALLVVTVVAIAVPIAISVGGGGGNEDQRRSDVMQVLSDVLGETEPQLGTDQRTAFDFIVDTDETYSTLSNPNKIRQRYALAVFFFSTGGYTTWPTARNWLNEDYDECRDWEYIKCYEGDVNELEIPSKLGLEGSLPTELAMLTALEFFQIEGNEVFPDGSIPAFVYDMTQLRFLVLQYAGLKGALSSSLLRLSNLEWLQLKGNDFSGRIPRELPPTLQLLHLSSNKLVDDLEEIINLTLPDLRFLELDTNMLEGSIPSTIGLATKLEQLNLDDNAGITGSVPSEMAQLTDLQLFSFQNTGISGQVPDEVCLLFTPSDFLRCSESARCDVTDFCPSGRMSLSGVVGSMHDSERRHHDALARSAEITWESHLDDNDSGSATSLDQSDNLSTK